MTNLHYWKMIASLRSLVKDVPAVEKSREVTETPQLRTHSDWAQRATDGDPDIRYTASLLLEDGGN
jgi:hypothetical protein